MKIRRALISVSDKSDILEFCRKLAAMDVELISTGGTAALLRENGLSVLEVADCTGFPEIMAGRVKTLHPKIHGGLLGRRGIDDTLMEEHGIPPIDLVAINLYPFEKIISAEDCSLEEAIENIDIGGPAMLRSAAKNYTAVAVACDREDYTGIIEEMNACDGELTPATRFRLACKAFAHTAHYDANIANYLGALDETGKHVSEFPSTLTLQFTRRSILRYGENPHQTSAFYAEPCAAHGTLAHARQIQGKQPSYNNIADSDVALECALQFAQPACVIVKHANPCGVAVAESPLLAWQKAYATDPTSAYGGVIAFNRTLDEKTCKALLQQQYAEVIIAPSISKEAIRAAQKKPAIRLLETGDRCPQGKPCAPPPQMNLKRVSGGLLIQDNDRCALLDFPLKVTSQRQPSEVELTDLRFAWLVAKFVKSNAIVYALGQSTIGIGAGQSSRIHSVRIATLKAQEEGLQTHGAVMASDAFFPFRDGIDEAAKAGISAIIQPGGSIRDSETIAAANEHGMAMVFTGMRHFFH
ncbi:MAG: bifunctional phosphoribosylaminoimidazolecarboxamide formyltransferase/IMP cyclohydrolase [Candidatus Eutrophobiaceae bacterium]